MSLLRADASDDAIIGAFAAAVRAKGPGGLLQIERPEHYLGLRNMSRVGG